MKVVIAGTTGTVGKELVLSVACDDFENYSDSVKKELKDADACIWTIAVTPINLSTVSFDVATKVSRDYPVTALKTLDNLRSKKDSPLRYAYISGDMVRRDPAEVTQAAKDHGLAEYCLMRGEAETQLLEYAAQSNGTVQSQVVRPGVIDIPGAEKRDIPGLPNVDLRHVAGALLDQVINGFEKDLLSNADLVRIGEKVLP